MLAYEANLGFPIRLYHLDPTRFLLPAAGETSIFDLDYEFDGLDERHFQTLVVPDGETIAAAIFLRPATPRIEPPPGNGGEEVIPGVEAAALSVAFAPPTRNYSRLSFHSSTRAVSHFLGADGTRFTVTLAYEDGTVVEREGEHRPASAEDRSLREFTFEIDSARALRAIRLHPHDPQGLPDWWAICNPVLR